MPVILALGGQKYPEIQGHLSYRSRSRSDWATRDLQEEEKKEEEEEGKNKEEGS